MSGSLQEKYAFILVRPEQLGNIGSVARVMKNFGLFDLRLVDAPRNYKDAAARKMAVGAFDVLKACSNYNDLASAIEDLHFVIGTSSGQQRKQVLAPIDEVLNRPSIASRDCKVGIVFGEERNGLRTEELDRCHVIATIPSNPDFLSLNLAQAACVIGYELSKIDRLAPSVSTSAAPSKMDATSDIPSPRSLPSVAEIDQLFELVSTLIDITDFSRSYNKAKVTAEIRNFYLRAIPTKRECDLLRGILHKLNQSILNSGESS
jgi:TrmH family RNA methyltransferase